MSRLYVLLALVMLAAFPAYAALTATSSRSLNLEGYTFEKYVKEYKKEYTATEYAQRRAIFNDALAEVRAHNNKEGQLYFKGINHMSDWTPEEFRRINGAKPHTLTRKRLQSRIQTNYAKTSETLPAEVDYRKAFPSILTAVKDQGRCGSCWAHSATEAIETHYAIKTQRLFVLSQQQVSACTPNPRHCGGSGGCNGGVEPLAYEYVHEVGGITEEWVYPYTQYSGQTGTCNNDTTRFVHVDSYVTIPQNDQSALMEALVTKGPIAVGVDASLWGAYGGGVFNGCTYAGNKTAIDHAVQLVGYGHDKTLNVDYWLIRNSWSANWGENGYIRLLRTPQAECGWDVNTHDGSACEGDSNIAWICGMCGILYSNTYPVVS